MARHGIAQALPSVLDVVTAEASRFNRYPDMFATALTAAIAETPIRFSHSV